MQHSRQHNTTWVRAASPVTAQLFHTSRGRCTSGFTPGNTADFIQRIWFYIRMCLYLNIKSTNESFSTCLIICCSTCPLRSRLAPLGWCTSPLPPAYIQRQDNPAALHTNLQIQELNLSHSFSKCMTGFRRITKPSREKCISLSSHKRHSVSRKALSCVTGQTNLDLNPEMRHNKSPPVVWPVNKYSEWNGGLRCLFSMGKARAGQGLFVPHYQINATEGARRGTLEELFSTDGRVNSFFSRFILELIMTIIVIFKAHFDILKQPIYICSC